MPWYAWYLATGLVYYAIRQICKKRERQESLRSAYESTRQLMIAEETKRGHFQVEKYGEREVDYPLTTWGRVKISALDDTAKTVSFLERHNGLHVFLWIVVIVFAIFTWPRELFGDMQGWVRNYESKN